MPTNLPNDAALIWCLPLTPEAPCGPNLEYDPQYMLLTASMHPQSDVQYGEFIAPPPTPIWSDIERECRALLARSKDIAMLIVYLRCRMQQVQASGLLEGLTHLVAVLETFPKDIHPQTHNEGVYDPELRQNALAALADPEGLLAELRKLSIGNQLHPLRVRDVEQAFSSAPVEGAIAADTMRQQLVALHLAQEPSMVEMAQTYQQFLRLKQWISIHLPDHSPDLSALEKILCLFDPSAVTMPIATSDMHDIDQTAPLDTAFHASSNQQRQTSIQAMRDIRSWFETCEPSSPVALLLWKAEALVGKRFAEVVHSIPAELLAQWETEMQQTK
jgi:type VI secretion system protein ImpA